MRKKNFTTEYVVTLFIKNFIFKPIELLFKYKLSRSIIMFSIGLYLLLDNENFTDNKLAVTLLGILLTIYPLVPIFKYFFNKRSKKKTTSIKTNDISKVK
jgi:hypothetical protein